MRSTAFVSTLVLSASLSAQITYLDADAATNTTLADGSALTPSTTNNSSDDNWSIRPFANGGTILSSNDINVSGKENAPMLRTTIKNLMPGKRYTVYTYFWGSVGGLWRGRATVASSQPTPEIRGWNTVHFSSSGFDPTTPLALGSPAGDSQTSLNLALDANGFETSGRFTAPTLLREADRYMFEAPMGTFAADSNGEIHVYVDDLANTSNGNRTWYDGVGYEAAPEPYGTACGSATIDYEGSTTENGTFTVKTASGAASAPCILIVGTSNTVWNGVNLPFDLTPIGFPGCALNAAYDLGLALSTDSTGAAMASLSVPDSNAVTSLYFQWVVLNGSTIQATRGLSAVFHP